MSYKIFAIYAFFRPFSSLFWCAVPGFSDSQSFNFHTRKNQFDKIKSHIGTQPFPKNVITKFSPAETGSCMRELQHNTSRSAEMLLYSQRVLPSHCHHYCRWLVGFPGADANQTDTLGNAWKLIDAALSGTVIPFKLLQPKTHHLKLLWCHLKSLYLITQSNYQIHWFLSMWLFPESQYLSGLCIRKTHRLSM